MYPLSNICHCGKGLCWLCDFRFALGVVLVSRIKVFSRLLSGGAAPHELSHASLG